MVMIKFHRSQKPATCMSRKEGAERVLWAPLIGFLNQELLGIEQKSVAALRF